MRSCSRATDGGGCRLCNRDVDTGGGGGVMSEAASTKAFLIIAPMAGQKGRAASQTISISEGCDGKRPLRGAAQGEDQTAGMI